MDEFNSNFTGHSSEDETLSELLRLTRPPESRIRQIWAVGGGKGGIGKSLISSSFAITLAKLGHRVICIDLDLGGANLHTSLGVDLPNWTLSDFLADPTQPLTRFVTPTPQQNLFLISGARDSLQVTELSSEKKVALLKSIQNLEADFIILDLGAGTNLYTVDFFLFADAGVIALLPEPTSIENAYRFIKAIFFRKLLITPTLKEVHYLIEAAMDSKNTLNIRTPSELYQEVARRHPELSETLRITVESFRPKLIVNQTRTQMDVDIGFSIKSVCKKYFGIDMDYVGYLDYDSSVWQSIRRKKPLVLEFPNSRLVSNVERMTQVLMKRITNSKL